MNISRQTREFSSIIGLLLFAAAIITTIVTENESFWSFLLFFFFVSFLLFIGLCFITALIEYPRMRKFEKSVQRRLARLESAYKQLLPNIREFQKENLPPANMRKSIVVSRSRVIISFLCTQHPEADEEEIIRLYEELGGVKNDILLDVAYRFRPDDVWIILESRTDFLC